jgi:penicillin-binding protein 1C
MHIHFSKRFPYFHMHQEPETLLDRIESRRRRGVYIVLFILLGLVTVGLGLVFAFQTYLVYAEDLVSKDRLLNRHFKGLIIYDKANHIIYESDGAHDVGTISISAIPRNVKYATLAVEDAHFYDHAGFSWGGILRSVALNFQSSNAYAYGGSTITQQLVKNALLDDQSKSYTRKLKELILAVGVDKRYSKEQVLEMYVNSNYYGRGAYGIGEASVAYFGMTIDKVSLAQGAFLAGLPNAPSLFSENFNLAIKRQQFVLQRMRDEKFITDTDYDEALKEKISVVERKIAQGKYPHFSLYIRQRILGQYGEDALERSGYRVFTTLDSAAQDIAQEAVTKQVAELAKNKVTNGAAVVLNPKTGGILAMIGSADWDNDAIDGKVNVTLTPQQPGSSFKPYMYMRALEKNKITAATQLDDSPTDFGGYSPHNYDNKFRGKVTTRRALANSLNLPAVQVMKMVGVVDGVSYAKSLGLTQLGEPSNYGLSLVLGAAEVTPLEMTTGYATLANNGMYNQAYAIEKIVDKYGKTIYAHDSKPVRVANENAAYIISNILSDNTARQEIFGPTSLKLPSGRPAAVKTGTTDAYRDAWTIGYTPSLVVGVWVGNNDNTAMDSIAGSLGAAPIWKDIMEGVLKGSSFQQFSRPPGVVEGEMCSLVEKHVNENGQDKKFYEFNSAREVYIKGSVQNNCDAVRKQVQDLQAGMGLTNPSVLQPAVAGDSTEQSVSPFPTFSPDKQSNDISNRLAGSHKRKNRSLFY